MPRQLTSAVEAAFESQHVPFLEFYELDFASGILRLTNAIRSMDWNGVTWTGAGHVGARSTIEESGGFSAPQVSLTLSGVTPAMLQIALGEQYRNRPARIWCAPLDANNVPIVDPAGPWIFRMDAMPITFGESSSIGLTLSTREEAWDRATNERFSDAWQQARYPGDKFFAYIDQQSQGETIWGALPTQPAAPAPPPPYNPYSPISQPPPVYTVPGNPYANAGPNTPGAQVVKPNPSTGNPYNNIVGQR